MGAPSRSPAAYCATRHACGPQLIEQEHGDDECLMP